MIEKAFIDTNIFIYAFEKGTSPKKEAALELLGDENRYLISSIQVLNEFVSATTRKGLLNKNKAVEISLLLSEDFEISSLDKAIFKKAMEIFNGNKIHISLWDALILSTAIINRCKMIYTEDLQHNYAIEGLRIINPFLNREN